MDFYFESIQSFITKKSVMWRQRPFVRLSVTLYQQLIHFSDFDQVRYSSSSPQAVEQARAS